MIAEVTTPHYIIVQPRMPGLVSTETVMYYSMDLHDKLQPLAEMQFDRMHRVKPFPVKGNAVQEYRKRDRVKKNWREKVGKRNFKQELGDAMTRSDGIYHQPFLCFRVDCYSDKLNGGKAQDNLVNSMGIFPLVDIQVPNANHEIVDMVIGQHCEWVERVLLRYPMA
jgi:hypothetical protein